MPPNLTNPSAIAGRRDAYDASVRGRRFIATNIINTPIVLPVGFVDTTPTLMLRLSATTRKVTFRSIIFSLTTAGGTPADHVRMILVLDTTDRWSAGGTVHTAYSMNEESPILSVVTAFYSLPTATAAGVGVRPETHIATANTVGVPFGINYGDGLILGKTSSLLFYIFTMAGTAAQGLFTVEWDEME